MLKLYGFPGIRAESSEEKLQIARQREKLQKNLGSIADLTRLPSALFVVDVMKEHIAVKEANRLGIPVFGIVDTNSNPRNIDYIIPGNDDASKSIDIILSAVVDAIGEGLKERKMEKEKEQENNAEKQEKKAKGGRARIKRGENAELNANVAEKFLSEAEKEEA